MGHYIINFTVYILAMSGLIALALFIYKKVTSGTSFNKNSKLLSIEESLMINTRKTLMIVRAGNERFLIASDVDKTALISKLNDEEKISKDITNNDYKIKKHNSIVDLTKIQSSIEKENMDILFPKKSQKTNKSITENDDKNIVHFEVIKDKNPHVQRARKTPQNSLSKNVTIEVGKVNNHGLSTIKEIVHKINEI